MVEMADYVCTRSHLIMACNVVTSVQNREVVSEGSLKGSALPLHGDPVVQIMDPP